MCLRTKPPAAGVPPPPPPVTSHVTSVPPATEHVTAAPVNARLSSPVVSESVSSSTVMELPPPPPPAPVTAHTDRVYKISRTRLRRHRYMLCASPIMPTDIHLRSGPLTRPEYATSSPQNARPRPRPPLRPTVQTSLPISPHHFDTWWSRSFPSSAKATLPTPTPPGSNNPGY